jgi:uncharacterized DUF497 family protein
MHCYNQVEAPRGYGMRFFQLIWDDEDNPEGNVQHIAEHGLTTEDVEYVLENPSDEATSSSSGRPCYFGYTPGGDYIIVIYEQIDTDTIYPVTAYEVDEP